MEEALVQSSKPSIPSRLRWVKQDIKWFFKRNLDRFALKILRWNHRKDRYLKHAKSEFKFKGWPGDCEMQSAICEHVLDMLVVFGTESHSGSSAPYAINLFKTLASFEPIGPLTGEDEEWGEPFMEAGPMQNKRCSHVFKGPDGVAYDTKGKIFREPDGCCYSNRESRVNITFPYVPKTEYVDVPADQE